MWKQKDGGNKAQSSYAAPNVIIGMLPAFFFDVYILGDWGMILEMCKVSNGVNLGPFYFD